MIHQNQQNISCICNYEINSAESYKLVILKEVTDEIDIFCPNQSCSVKELGYIKFKRNKDNSISFSKAKFYPTFVSYNITSTNDPKYFILKNHLIYIAKNRVNWTGVSKFLQN